MTFSKLNYINVGPEGTFAKSGDYKSEPGDIDRLIDHLRAEGKGHIVIHFHGGLVSEKKGMEIAEKMLPVYDAAGAHPYSVVWETGFVETLKDNLTQIDDTKLFQKILKYVLKWVSKEIGVEFGNKGPAEPLSDSEIEAELDGERRFTELEEAANRTAVTEAELESIRIEMEAEIEIDLEADSEFQQLIEDEAPQTETLRKDVLSDSVEDGQKGLLSLAKAAKTIAAIAYRTIRRIKRKRDHGFYCTVVEETLREAYIADFGTWTWGRMKDKAVAMFDSNQNRTGDGLRAGRYLLDKLLSLQQERPDFNIDLVGHSAGSIAICHLLATAAATGGPSIRKVAFLAPAVRTDLFHQEMFTHPQRFQQFRMYTMDDDFEKEDELVKILYPRSLLYFISGVLEPNEADETLLGMHRHVRGVPPYTEQHLVDIKRFLGETCRQALSVTDDSEPEGMRTASTSHGGFDDDAKTRDSLTHYVAGQVQVV